MVKKSPLATGIRMFNCDICSGDQAIELPFVRRYTNGQVIHICKNCGFIYVRMRRPFHRIAEVWSKELFGKAYTSATPLMLARHTYIAEFLRQKLGLKNKTVCDIGAEEGQFLNILKNNYQAAVFGIEPSANNCRLLAGQKVASFCGTLEEYLACAGNGKEFADIATMMWTLENATSPKELVLGARELLKPGGYLLVATGSRILVPFAKPLDLYLSSNPVDAHPSRFSRNSLCNLLRICGFKPEFVNSYLNDALLMCVLAKKTKIPDNPVINKDDYRQVKRFFQKWHQDSRFFNGFNK